MTTSLRKRFLLLALCVGAMAGSPDCPSSRTTRYQFTLLRALPEGFAVPDSVVSEGYLLKSTPAGDSAVCKGMHPYAIHSLLDTGRPSARTEILDLRIDSTRSMVEIVTGFSPDLGGDPEHWAALAARLAVAGTGDVPRVTPSRTEKIGNDKQFRAWCAGRMRR
jgi:hypothetical protein